MAATPVGERPTQIRALAVSGKGEGLGQRGGELGVGVQERPDARGKRFDEFKGYGVGGPIEERTPTLALSYPDERVQQIRYNGRRGH
jgi:hypothetical protein